MVGTQPLLNDIYLTHRVLVQVVGLMQLLISLPRIGSHLLDQLVQYLLSCYLDIHDVCMDIGWHQVFGTAGIAVQEDEIHRCSRSIHFGT